MSWKGRHKRQNLKRCCQEQSKEWRTANGHCCSFDLLYRYGSLFTHTLVCSLQTGKIDEMMMLLRERGDASVFKVFVEPFWHSDQGGRGSMGNGQTGSLISSQGKRNTQTHSVTDTLKRYIMILFVTECAPATVLLRIH